jgi:hypothetical protein
MLFVVIEGDIWGAFGRADERWHRQRSAAFLTTAIDLIADCGYDTDWFRTALTTNGVTPCILHARTVKQSRYSNSQ